MWVRSSDIRFHISLSSLGKGSQGNPIRSIRDQYGLLGLIGLIGKAWLPVRGLQWLIRRLVVCCWGLC